VDGEGGEEDEEEEAADGAEPRNELGRARGRL